MYVIADKCERYLSHRPEVFKQWGASRFWASSTSAQIWLKCWYLARVGPSPHQQTPATSTHMRPHVGQIHLKFRTPWAVRRWGALGPRRTDYVASPLLHLSFSHSHTFSHVFLFSPHYTISQFSNLNFSLSLCLSVFPLSGLDHRPRRIRGVLLRGRVRLPAELLHERHKPCYCANPREWPWKRGTKTQQSC